MELQNFKPKSFWDRPEGTTGKIFLGGLVLVGGYLLYIGLPILNVILANTITFVALLAVLGAIVFMALDPRMRNLVSYGYKSIMRAITGLFVQLDPIGILKSYVRDLENNLRKMAKQIGTMKSEMIKLRNLIDKNKKDIQQNLSLASRAKAKDKKDIMILKSRKAGRLEESNLKLEDLHKKMEILYRVLLKMYDSGSILIEDVKDQVMVKEQERKAIRTSHSAMKSAMNVLNGDKDKRAMFDQALEAIADDVGNKIGEMENFMEMSSSFMDSIDLQNGVFEEEGLKMLEKWEKEGISLILGDEKKDIIAEGESPREIDLDAPIKSSERAPGENQYKDLFDF